MKNNKIFNINDVVFTIDWATREVFETQITSVLQHYADGFTLAIDNINGSIFETIFDRLGPVPGMTVADLDKIEKGYRYYQIDEKPRCILDNDEVFSTREEAEENLKLTEGLFDEV